MTTPLGSRYELIDMIAGGATGSVWRARIVKTGEFVAAKQIRAEFATDADVVDRFLRERRVLTSIDHPAVVRLRDLVVEGDQITLVMDLVVGADLRHALAAAGTFAPTSAALAVATIADALAAAHAAGIVHADVKPANVLVPSDGGPVRLADFGVSRLIRGPARLSYGTPEYIAPEVVQGHASIPASDVYGLGILFYELLTGTTPYRGGSSAEVMSRHVSARPIWTDAVPQAVRPLLTGCLQRVPTRRPSADSLASDLRELAATLAGLPAAAPLPGGTPHYQLVPVAEVGDVPPDDRVTSVLPAKPAPGALPPPPPWAIPPGAARPARKHRRWPLVLSLAAACVVALAAVALGVVFSGVLTTTERNEVGQSSQPSQQVPRTPTPSPSRPDGSGPSTPPGAPPTDIPGLPKPGETMPAAPQGSVPSGDNQIGQPIN